MPASNLASVDPRQQFTCCFCLHVRTGTIIYGVFQIMLQLLFVCVLLLATFNSNFGLIDTSNKAKDSRKFLINSGFTLMCCKKYCIMY